MATKKKPDPYEVIERTVPIKKVVGKVMHLKNAVGDGKIDGVKLSICNIVPTGDLHVVFNDDWGRGVYICPMADFVQEAYEDYKERKGGDA